MAGVIIWIVIVRTVCSVFWTGNGLAAKMAARSVAVSAALSVALAEVIVGFKGVGMGFRGLGSIGE